MCLKTILEVIIMRAGIVCMIIGFVVSALGIRAIHDKIEEAKDEGIKTANGEDSTEQESSDTIRS